MTALLAIGAASASAAPETRPAFSYFTTFAFGELSSGEVNSVAVGGGGEIFAADVQFGAVRIYAPDANAGGVPLATVEAAAAGVNPTSVAVDPGTGDLYVADLFIAHNVKRFVSDGQPVPTYTVDPTFELSSGEGFAVDPTTHDLLIGDGAAGSIRRYDTAGSLVETISTPLLVAKHIAVAPDGTIYVAGGSSQDVAHLSATGTVLGTVGGVGSVGALAVDQSDGTLVAVVGSHLKAYDSSGAFLSESSLARGSGVPIAIDGGSGRLYAFVGNLGPGSGAIDTYESVATPGVEAPVVSEIGSASATVSTEVNPGPEGGTAHFEYSANGGSSWSETPEQAVPAAGPIDAELTGLLLNTEYLVRVKASNGYGSSESSSTTFSTPEVAPVVETGPAGGISQDSAMLNGTVNPAGIQTSYHFEYGTSSAYGSRIPLNVDAPAGNLRSPRQVSQFVSGLQPGTTYHYRLVATSAKGRTFGEDRTFTTVAVAEAFPQRGYEQVTPVDKGGAVVEAEVHVQSTADGSAITMATRGASKDSNSSLMLQNYVSRRGSDNWLNWQQVDPPQDGLPGLNESGTAAISEDFQHALVISNRALAPGGIAGGGNLYVKDLRTGSYTFVGGAPGNSAWNLMVGIELNETIFLAGAPDFSWLVFRAYPPLLPGVSAAAMYRWSEKDGLSVVSVFPGGFVPPIEVRGGTGKQGYRVVSSDGTIAAYQFGTGTFGPIFRRVGGQEPIAVSESHIPGSEELVAGGLEGMTPDGRYVFFVADQALTEDAPPPGGASNLTNLYRYDALTDEMLFIGQALRAPSDHVVLGFGDNGQTVYFTTPEDARVWHDGQVRVINSEAIHTPIRYVTGNGRYLAWTEEAPENPPSFEDYQAHLYDLTTDTSTCVSCPAAGAPAGPAHFMGGANIGNTTSRVVTEGGEMFFDTATRLVPSDHNGTKDVYAYKKGHLSLISPGDEPFDAIFVDASADGSNVFFQTNQGLVPQDVDRSADIYDARVGGGFSAQSPPPPPGTCKGPECAGAGGAPSGGPAVATTASRRSHARPVDGRIRVRKVTVGRRAVRVKVHVSQPGRLKIDGRLVKTTIRKVTKPGTYTLSVPLTSKAKALRRQQKKFTVVLKIRLSGGWGSTSAKFSKTLGK